MLEQEFAADEDDFGTGPLTDEDLARAELKGLVDEASLRVFVLWYSFGGLQRGLSVGEIEGMSQARMADFQYLLAEIGERRKRLRKQEKG